jgi:hypothetical protein
MRRLAALGLLVAATLWGAGCTIPPGTTSSLAEPGAPYDPKLVGTWMMYDGEVLMVLHVAPREDSVVTDVTTVICCEDDAAPSWVLFAGFAAEIDGATYINLAYADSLVSGDDKDIFAELIAPGEHLLARTELTEDGRLYARFLSANALKHLAEAGRIEASEVRSGEYDTHWRVDITREDLIALIREVGPDKLFAYRWGPFVRVPATPEFDEEDPAWVE